MYGNGVRIGMDIIIEILKLILQALPAVLTGWLGAVAGFAMLGFAVCHIAIVKRLSTVIATSAFG